MFLFTELPKNDSERTLRIRLSEHLPGGVFCVFGAHGGRGACVGEVWPGEKADLGERNSLDLALRDVTWIVVVRPFSQHQRNLQGWLEFAHVAY